MVSIHVDDALYAKIAEAYERAKGPFVLTREGYPSPIIMRPSDLEEEAPLSDAGKASLLAGYKEYLNGDVVEAHEVISEIRNKYGL